MMLTEFVAWLYTDAVSIQRDIYTSFADRIKLYSETGAWSHLVIFLPVSIIFGAIHALTPGHSKTLLAAYTAASPGSLGKAISTAFILSAVHVLISVIIVLLSLPLVSSMLGSVGEAPILQNLSRGLIGLIGVWMIWAALRPTHTHLTKTDNRAFAVFAGLIPCPLTLFVMTFALSRGVVEAGLAFAVVMLLGIFITLGTLAAFVSLARLKLVGLMSGKGKIIIGLGRGLQVLVGIGFIVVAALTLTN